MNTHRILRLTTLVLAGSLVLHLSLRANGDADLKAKRDAELTTAAADAAIVRSGGETYAGLCLACHGAATATGGSPSDLFDDKWYHGSRPHEIENTVLKGVLEKGMPGWGEVLPPEDTMAVTAYILSQRKG